MTASELGGPPGRIHGAFPGGPRRTSDTPAPGRSGRHLRRVEEIEASMTRRQRSRTRRQRRNRLLGGAVAFAVLSFLAGMVLGSAGHATQESLTQAEVSARTRDRSISSEVNRTLLELWRMEDVEALRGSRQIR